MTADDARVRVLAISSGGGHWVQLLRLAQAFDDCEVHYATVRAYYRADVGGAESFHTVPDATRWDRLRLIGLFFKVGWLLVRLRPAVIVTTGAAPGHLAILLGGLLGSYTVWVDSMANTERLSMSGQSIGPRADVWLTQWSHLARPGGPEYAGAVV